MAATEIGLAHLEAALSVWRFCEASARFLFAKPDNKSLPPSSSEGELWYRLHQAIVDRPGINRSRLWGIVGHNVSKGELDEAFARLEREGLAHRRSVPQDGSGRSAECWYPGPSPEPPERKKELPELSAPASSGPVETAERKKELPMPHLVRPILSFLPPGEAGPAKGIGETDTLEPSVRAMTESGCTVIGGGLEGLHGFLKERHEQRLAKLKAGGCSDAGSGDRGEGSVVEQEPKPTAHFAHEGNGTLCLGGKPEPPVWLMAGSTWHREGDAWVERGHFDAGSPPFARPERTDGESDSDYFLRRLEAVDKEAEEAEKAERQKQAGQGTPAGGVDG